MPDPTTQQGWIDAADARTSRLLRTTFPPENPMPLQKCVRAAWESFSYLQGLRRSKTHRGNRVIACAEHYAYARVTVCAGGVLIYPLIVTGSLTYQTAKTVFEKVGLLQLFGQLTSAGNSTTTPGSVDQLKAAVSGAEEGLALHFGL